jgi:hemerythrin-like domain-containing protein
MLGSNSSRTNAFLFAGGAGLLLGLMANPLRKLAVQAPTMLKKDWDKALAAEHEATLALLDLIEATDEDDTARRAVHLAQLKHMLGKHSFQEENTVYAMMRERGLLEQAQSLNEEHGEVKRLLFDLTELPKGAPQWIAKVRELRADLEQHMALEENELFPALRAALSDEENAHLSVAMNKEGLKVA